MLAMPRLAGWIVLPFVLCAAGCNDERPPEQTKHLLPPRDDAVVIILEAEDGTVEPAMVAEEVEPGMHDTFGRQEASGGRCVAVPKGANKADKEKPKGKLLLPFEVPAEGVYYVHFRVRWEDECSNSFGLAVDAAPPLVLSGTTYKRWLWTSLRSDDVSSDAPRPFKLTKGAHTLTLTNREDDVKLDQVFVTDDPQAKAGGIMKAPE